MDLSKEKLIKMYEDMMKIRLFENRAKKLFNEGLIRGPMHLYIGQEAIAVGACANLRETDYITSTHRGHGHCIAKGGKLDKMMAELLGKATGYSKGKGGSMHIADPDIGILGANGIVGGGLGIAPGAGLSAKMRGTDQVTICFFGDGASNEGIFHESLNLAAVWDLPVVYLCENNKFGLTSKAEEVLSVEDVADRAAGYDIPGEVVNGNDVIAVYQAVKKAVERAKNNEGPTLIEAKTYRWEGHFVGDPCVYRDRSETKKWEDRCPVNSLYGHLESAGVSEKELDEIDSKIRQELDKAVEFAKNSPEPEIESIFEDIYAD